MAAFEVIVNDDGSIVVNDVDAADVITQVDEQTVVVQPDDSEVISIEQTTTVIEGDDGGVIISDVGVQGSAAESDVPFATRVDFVGETVIYKGQAQPGTVDATNGWRIQKIDIITGGDGQEDFEFRWADGVSDFSKVWDNRLGYSYT